MNYNFETVPTRYHTGSRKWAEMRDYFPDAGDDYIPFSVADMELATAPEIKAALKEYIDDIPLGYANPTDAFKQSVVDWMRRRHNWHIEPDWILGAHGVVSAFYTVIKHYTRPGEGVMLMTPVYYPMYTGITVNDRVLVDTPLVNRNGRYEIDFDDFAAKAADPNCTLLILCSPHNPTGRVWTRDELERIGRICLENGVLICSDEIHFDLVMPGFTHTVFAGMAEEFAGNCITCTSPSKTFNLAGLQTSNIIISNPRLRERFMDALIHDEPNPRCNVLGLVANRAAYEHGGAWLEAAIGLIDDNRRAVEDFMAAEFPTVVVTPLEGTYLQWLDFRGLGIEHLELGRRLREEARLFFDDGHIFGKQGEGFERWNLACPRRYIDEGLERLKKMLR